MANIKKGDLVQVISGPKEERGGDRGKQGRVLEVLKEKNRVIVEGVNFVTKHVRVGQTQRGSKTGGIETHEAPIHVSNVALVDPDTKQPARVGFRVETDENGKTSRVRYIKASKRAENAKPAKAEKKAPAKRRTEPVEVKAAAKNDAEPATDSAAEKDTE
jgi:large subunit ribosomal protein L24